MAEEVIVNAIKIDAGDSEMTVKKLKDRIKELQNELLNVSKGSKEYNAAVEELQADTRKLNEVMSLSKRTAVALDGSYDSLTYKMSQLKKEWKATNDEAKRNELGAQIAEINTQLKDMDAAVGDYQRNVGDYANATANGFMSLRQEIKEAKAAVLEAKEGTDEYSQALQRLGDAQKRMEDMNEMARYSANDLGNQLSNITTIASGVVGGFNALQGVMVLLGKDTENLQKTMVKLQAGMAIVQGLRGVEGLTKNLKGLTLAIKNVWKAMGPVGWAVTAVMALTAAITKLTKAFGSKYNNVTNYGKEIEELSKKIDNLKEKLSDSNAEFNREIKIKVSLGMSDEDVLKATKAQAEKQKSELKSIADKASSNVIAIRTEIVDKQTTDKRRKELEGLLEDAKTISKQAQEEYKKSVEAVKNAETELQVYYNNRKRKESEAAAESIKNLEQWREEVLENINIDITNADYNLDISDILNDAANELKAFQDGLAGFDADKYLKNWESLFKQINEIANAENTLRYSEGLITEEEYLQRSYELNLDYENRKLDAIREAEAQSTDPAESLQLQREIALQEISIAQIVADEKKRLDEEELARKQRLMDATITYANVSLQTISSVFSSIADIYESNEEDAEKNAKKVKGLRIAAATMDMLGGVVSAISSSMSPTNAGLTIAGQIAMAALTSAMVVANGAAQIAQIKNTDETGISTTTATPNIQAIRGNDLPINTYSRALTSASELESANNTDNKVYLVETEMIDAIRKVEIRESESSF